MSSAIIPAMTTKTTPPADTPTTTDATTPARDDRLYMIPTPGRIVEYTLTEQDAEQVNRRRKDAYNNRQNHRDAALGYVAHVGNAVETGQTYPMVIVRCWGTTEESSVNGQVLLDGADTLWVTSVSQGDGPRHWRAYPRV